MYLLIAFLLVGVIPCAAQGQFSRHVREYSQSMAPYVTSPQLIVDRMLQAASLKSGETIYDLGCGDGTTAVPLALLGADVVGIDIAKNLVDAGNKRAAEAGLDRLKFQQGDVCVLRGIGDHSFDLTISVFGAMFAPKPFDVAGRWCG